MRGHWGGIGGMGAIERGLRRDWGTLRGHGEDMGGTGGHGGDIGGGAWGDVGGGIEVTSGG